MTPVTLKHYKLKDLKLSMRVQSLSSKYAGEVVMIDIKANTVWIKWDVGGTIVPYSHDQLHDIFSVDN